MNFIGKTMDYLFPPRGLGLDIDTMRAKGPDPRNYNADILGAWFGASYEPKQSRLVLKTLTTKNQMQQNSCVCESCTLQKEPDEGVALSAQWFVAHLAAKGLMSRNGATLEAAQNEMRKTGIAEARFAPNDYSSSWEVFSRKSLLTTESYANAAKHKTKSGWITYELDTVLKWLDEGRIGHTGCEWFTGYNPSQLGYPYILKPFLGRPVNGHAFVIVGYDLNYYGNKVLICKTSWGPGIYDNEYFYLKFEDFKKVLTFGVWFNLDIDKDIASWLSLIGDKAVLEANGPKVYVIESDKKRHIPDEAFMWMLGVSPVDIVRDVDNMLPLVTEGEPMSIKDIPANKLDEIKYFVSMSRNEAFMTDRFSKYFPDLF